MILIFGRIRKQIKGPVEGHYLSRGGEGITWFLGEQKGVSIVTENPNEGITENSGRIQRGGPLKFAWKRHGGIVYVIKCY